MTHGDVIVALLLLVCVLCTFACLALACAAAIKLHEMRSLMDLADARMVELKRHYNEMQHWAVQRLAHPPASEAGSDVSRVSRVNELHGFDPVVGNGWVATTEGGVRQRTHTSPPRRMVSY